MHFANIAGRLALIVDDTGVDVEKASHGKFSSDPQAIYEQWEAFVSWASSASLPAGEAFDERSLGSPVPAPRQVLAIGLNYREHAAESGFAVPDDPTVFTKYVSCITGPYTEVRLPEGQVDWEVELVAVIGKRAEHVPAADAWSHLAGLTVGQDISERVTQRQGPAPQFSLGKSFPGFGPIGPWLVTVDEFADPDDLELGCAIDGEEMQKGRTSDLVFTVPQLIERLSAILPLLPGDVIFTGTPSGVGMGRSPQRFLKPGEELVSYIEGIGQLRQRFIASPDLHPANEEVS